MKIGIDPKIDCVFKLLFGTEENKPLLLNFINGILEKSGEPKVVELEILNPYNPKAYLKDKLSIVDVKAKNEHGEWFIIEMQIVMTDYYAKRLLYYWSRIYHSQLKESEKYHLLQKATLISISAEALPTITGKQYYNQFKLLSVQDRQTILCSDLSIHTIELSKFNAGSEQLNDIVEHWSYFFKHGEDLDENALPTSWEGSVMTQAVKELKKFTLDEIQREIYESRRMAIMDEVSYAYDNYLKGEQAGIQKGEIKGKIEGEIKGKIEGKIEATLEIRFGDRGLRAMDKIRAIQDIDRLNRIFLAAKNASGIEEFEAGL